MTGWRWASNRLLGSDGRPFFASWAPPGYRCVQTCLWATKDGVRSGARMVLPVGDLSIEEILREAEDWRAQGYEGADRALTALREGGSVDDVRAACEFARQHPQPGNEFTAAWDPPENVLHPRVGSMVRPPRWRNGWSPEDLDRAGVGDLVAKGVRDGWWTWPPERQPVRLFPSGKRVWYPGTNGEKWQYATLVRGRGLFQKRSRILLVGGTNVMPWEGMWPEDIAKTEG